MLIVTGFDYFLSVAYGVLWDLQLPSRRRGSGRKAEGNDPLKAAGLWSLWAHGSCRASSHASYSQPLACGPASSAWAQGPGGPILELALRSGSYNLSLEPHQSLIKTCPINVKKFTHKKIPCMKLKPYVLQPRFEILHNI